MKINIKKILAVLSSAVLSVNLICGSICSAEEAAPAYADSVQSGTDMSVYGTDTFGNMLAAELQSAQDEQIENDGQNIFSIEMTGKTAAVEYDVIEDCTVVVGIYDESGTTMLASGNAELSAEENSANVTIGIDTMPQYFYIKAFLIDKVTMRPLCSVYENPMYTQEMQEFLAMTVDDFDADKVYNLDDDKSNNFAVFKEDVTVLDTEPIYSSNSNAIFDSITDDMRNLTEGNTFAYYYGDELYIYTVSAVTIDDENGLAEITFTSDESAELNDVFDYVKVDGEALTKDSTATPTGDADEGVTYLGLSTETSDEKNSDVFFADDEYTSSDELSKDASIGGSVTVSHDFKIEKEFKSEIKDGDETASVTAKLSASLSFSATASAKVYITLDEQYVEMKLDYSAKLSATFTGSAKLEVPLGQELGFAICPGVYVGITPKIIAEISASITLEGTLSGTVGFKCDGKSITDLSTPPKFETKLKVEGKYYVGFSLSPRLNIVSKYVASAGIEAKVGVELNAKSDIYQWDSTQLVKHDCSDCITGDISAKLKVGFDIKLLNKDSLKFSITALEKTWKIFDFYYSDINGWNFGSCPNKSYKTKITVYDNSFNKLNDAAITVDGNTLTSDTNVFSTYLSKGTHKFKAECSGYRKSTKDENIKAVSSKPNNVIFYLYPDKYSGNGGISNSGETDDPNVNISIEKNRIDLGSSHSAYITTNGDLYTWGYNRYGQLGDGTQTDRYTPVKIMSNVAQVSLGDSHSACITTTGDLYTWGASGYGQLGDGTETRRYTPIKIMSNVAKVSLERDYSACITTNGDMYTWGRNDFGQLGNGTETDRYTPIKIMSNVSQVSLGYDHSACITTNGDLFTWGYNNNGQLGDGTTTEKYTPVKIMSNVAQVSFGGHHSACITTNGDLYTWGNNYYGQLGDGTTTDRYTPVKIMSNVAQVSLGYEHSACITTNGDLYTWGYNRYGQLGDGTKTGKSTPVKRMSNVSQVSLGIYHSACITTNGDLYTWGNNYYGKLGDGTTTDRSTPTKITIPTTAAMTAEKFYALSSQQFTGLLPNEVYNIYSMNSRTAEEPFGTDNLLYIDQKISDSNGNLNVEINTDKSGVTPEIFVKAMNGGEISNAEITSLTQSDNSAAISWEAVEGADKYTVYTIRNGIFIKEADTSELSYTVNGLIPETEYGFIVQAWVNGEYSVLDKTDAIYIIPISANTGDETPKPVIKTITPGDGQVFLEWNPVENATKYKVFYRINGTTAWTAKDTTATSFTVTGLTNGKEYEFLVRSYDGSAWSPFTSEDIVTATPKAAADKPKLTSITPGVDSVVLRWNAVDGAKSYRVFYRISGTTKWSFRNTTKTAMNLTGLTGGKKYDFLVLSYDGSAWSTFTDADIITATPKAAAAKPAFTSLTPGVNSVVLRWNAVEGATSYRVFYRINGTSKWSYKNTTKNAMNLTGLTGGKKYDLLVRSYNGSAWSTYAASDIKTATPIAASSKPLIYSAVPGTNSVVLRWNAVSGAKSYRVYYRVSGTSKWSYKNTTRNAMNLTGLTGGKTYEFVVRAYNGSTWTAYTSADIVKATIKS